MKCLRCEATKAPTLALLLLKGLDFCLPIIYNEFTADRSEVMPMSPRTGRPTDNPKLDRITVRLDERSKEVLTLYCAQEEVERAEAIRRGIKKLADELKQK